MKSVTAHVPKKSTLLETTRGIFPCFFLPPSLSYPWLLFGPLFFACFTAAPQILLSGCFSPVLEGVPFTPFLEGSGDTILVLHLEQVEACE